MGGDTILFRTCILSLGIPIDIKKSFHEFDKTIKQSHKFIVSTISCLLLLLL